jgi:hypothetical protein
MLKEISQGSENKTVPVLEAEHCVSVTRKKDIRSFLDALNIHER